MYFIRFNTCQHIRSVTHSKNPTSFSGLKNPDNLNEYNGEYVIVTVQAAYGHQKITVCTNKNVWLHGDIVTDVHSLTLYVTVERRRRKIAPSKIIYKLYRFDHRDAGTFKKWYG